MPAVRLYFLTSAMGGILRNKSLSIVLALALTTSEALAAMTPSLSSPSSNVTTTASNNSSNTSPATNDSNADHDNEKKKSGNLALPTSQLPGPLLSFGQNIIDKQLFQAFFLAVKYAAKDGYETIAVPALLYSFSDFTSIFVNVPLAPRNRQGKSHSSGFEDLFVQLEHAFYTKESDNYLDQATLVANVTIPTGSTKKNPPTGFGANTLFLGATASRIATQWYYFASVGGVWTSSSHGTKFGNQCLYQCGIGKNIANIDDWLLLWMVEFDGTYAAKDTLCRLKDRNSGGNVIYMTPSLWVSSTHLILQLGAGYAIQQHLNGKQPRNRYLLALNLGWTF